MNKLLVLAAVAAITACDAVPSGISNNPLITVDYEYEIDTYGFNSEVYEFTPKSNTNKSCVFLMLDSGKAMGLQCFNK